jgi:hypothetical protein
MGVHVQSIDRMNDVIASSARKDEESIKYRTAGSSCKVTARVYMKLNKHKHKEGKTKTLETFSADGNCKS